jgi:hypothetical protein
MKNWFQIFSKSKGEYLPAVGAIAITNRPSVLCMHSQKISSTKCLYVMAIAPTSHHNFLTFLTFLESFYILLINRKKVLKQSEDLSFSPLVHAGKI